MTTYLIVRSTSWRSVSGQQHLTILSRASVAPVVKGAAHRVALAHQRWSGDRDKPHPLAMGTDASFTRPPVRWWSWWLVAHAATIAAILTVYGFTTGSPPHLAIPTAVFTLTSLFSLPLSTPWWLVVGALWVIPLSDDDTALIALLDWVTQALPLLINLAVHAVLLNLVRRRRAFLALAAARTCPQGPAGSPAGAPPGSRAAGGRRSRALLLCAVAGALTWLAWLGGTAPPPSTRSPARCKTPTSPCRSWGAWVSWWQGWLLPADRWKAREV